MLLEEKLVYRDLSRSIIGASMTVLNSIKCGHDEKIYERSLVIELRKRGHAIDQQRRFVVQYEGHEVGELIPDLIVDSRVIVDPKVVEEFNNSHLAQMQGYLAITGLKLAMLVNFKHDQLKWKRVVRSR
jgi:GxxExxY protein